MSLNIWLYFSLAKVTIRLSLPTTPRDDGLAFREDLEYIIDV
jgi:hypothetical protein